MVALLISIGVLVVTLWGLGLVFAAVSQQVPRYFVWTRRAIGWFIQAPFRVVRNFLTSAATYLWRHWRREITWFLIGAGTAIWVLLNFFQHP